MSGRQIGEFVSMPYVDFLGLHGITLKEDQLLFEIMSDLGDIYFDLIDNERKSQIIADLIAAGYTPLKQLLEVRDLSRVDIFMRLMLAVLDPTSPLKLIPGSIVESIIITLSTKLSYNIGYPCDFTADQIWMATEILVDTIYKFIIDL